MSAVAWPIVTAIAGALVYAFTNGKASELGRAGFWVGLFWLVYLLAMGHPLRL